MSPVESLLENLGVAVVVSGIVMFAIFKWGLDIAGKHLAAGVSQDHDKAMAKLQGEFADQSAKQIAQLKADLERQNSANLAAIEQRNKEMFETHREQTERAIVSHEISKRRLHEIRIELAGELVASLNKINVDIGVVTASQGLLDEHEVLVTGMIETQSFIAQANLYFPSRYHEQLKKVMHRIVRTVATLGINRASSASEFDFSQEVELAHGLKREIKPLVESIREMIQAVDASEP